MITSLGIVEGRSFDPYYNLALEQVLLESVKEDQCILYLWQNQNTVVIGRNQNPWKECRTALLSEEGGRLSRRLSGGGAVFHDLGNLNFTFLVPQSQYDLDKQLTVIQKAVGYCGLDAQRSGRNDILVDGRKFSGNAFYKNGKQAYHHGTLMVNVEKEKLGRYLSPSKAKLQSKGVDSVRSRVANLRDFNPDITIEGLKAMLVRSFGETYGCEAEYLSDDAIDWARVDSLTQRNSSWEWLYGNSVPMTASCEERFAWGGLEVEVQVENGTILQSRVYSDAMEWELASGLEAALTGCSFRPEDIAHRLAANNVSNAEEICDFLCRTLF